MTEAELYAQLNDHPDYVGVVVAYPGGWRIRLARAGGLNVRFKEALARAMARRSLALAAHESLDDVSEELARLIVAETYAEACVLEVYGRDAPKGFEAVTEWILKDEVRFDDLRALAENGDNYIGERREYGNPAGVQPSHGGDS